ncbi:hypothetical protein EDC04DRAFT_2608185 [Pisolithus marmoratus]|nr:hypothetical protein EDC04DRAFT_2608185 [Pisolithus marmoratus]
MTGFLWGVIIMGSRHGVHAASMSTFAKSLEGGKQWWILHTKAVGGVWESCTMRLGVVPTLKTGFSRPVRLERLCLNYAASLDCKNAKKTISVSEGFSMGSTRKTKYLGNDGGARRISGVIRSIASTRGISPRIERFGFELGKICIEHEQRGKTEGGVESRENKRLGEYAHPILRYPQIGPNYPTIHQNAHNSGTTAAAVARKAPLERTRYRVGNFEGEGDRVVFQATQNPSQWAPDVKLIGRDLGDPGGLEMLGECLPNNDEMITIGEDEL